MLLLGNELREPARSRDDALRPMRPDPLREELPKLEDVLQVLGPPLVHSEQTLGHRANLDRGTILPHVRDAINDVLRVLVWSGTSSTRTPSPTRTPTSRPPTRRERHQNLHTRRASPTIHSGSPPAAKDSNWHLAAIGNVPALVDCPTLARGAAVSHASLDSSIGQPRADKEGSGSHTIHYV